MQNSSAGVIRQLATLLVAIAAFASCGFGQSVQWSPFRESQSHETSTFSVDEPSWATDSQHADAPEIGASASVPQARPQSQAFKTEPAKSSTALPRITTNDAAPHEFLQSTASQIRPTQHEPTGQPTPAVSLQSMSSIATSTAAQVENELRAMTQPPAPQQTNIVAIDTAQTDDVQVNTAQTDDRTRSEQQVAQLIDGFLTPEHERLPPNALAENRSNYDPRSVNAAVQAFRRRLLSEKQSNSDSNLATQTVNEFQSSQTRKVIPFGVRNDRVEVKSHGENISLVARDAPLKEILSMLAKSQKLNLIFASSPPALGSATPRGRTGSSPGSSFNNSEPQLAGGTQPTRGGGIASQLLAAGASAVSGPPSASATPSGGFGATGLNAAGGVNANMTVTLEDVALDTALDMILSVAGFTWTRTQGIILVTPTDGNAQLPPNAQGRIMQVFELDFAVAEDLDTAIQGLLSPVGQSFATASLINDNRRSIESIVVEDMPRYVDRIADYISQVDVPPRQVAIQAYILEVELGSNLRHGVNLEYMSSLLDPTIRLGSTGFARTTPSQAFFLELDASRLDGLLEALRTTVDAKTLASPRIIAVNGQESRLQVGEQLGFRITTTTQTSTLESVQFLNVGVVLAVTPRISRDGRVLLHVSPEVSSGQVNPATGLPEEETAELQTDVLLEDGQGIVVGGLIKEDMNNGQSKIPGLGDVPYLGALFENRVENRSRTEIIVALVPKVLPLDHHRQATQDFEVHRATTPLMHGSLVENARPYEPSLPDPLREPVRNHHLKADWEDQRQAARYGHVVPSREDLRTSALRQASYEGDPMTRHHVTPHHSHPRTSPWQFLRRPKIWSNR